MDMTSETMAGKTEDATREAMNATASTMNKATDTMGHAAAAGDKMVRDTMERASAMGDQAFKDGMEKSMVALNELNAQSKRSLEAVVESVTAATKGVETLSNEAMAYTKKAMEGQVEQAKALSGARSVQEVVELQSSYAKTAMESYIAQMNKATEIMTAAVKESFRPLNERATAMVETLQSQR